MSRAGAGPNSTVILASRYRMDETPTDKPLSRTLRPLIVAAALTSLLATMPPGSAAVVQAPAPLFADPHYHGSCDPEVVWNTHESTWWIFYTARRATRPTATYVGTPIGVASSPDLATWTFLGYCSFEGRPGQPDLPVTFWAPGIIRQGDTYHMFVTYKENATPPWGGHGTIRHYTAPANDLLHGWSLAPTPEFTSPDPIDASLIRVGDRYHAYYRVTGTRGGIHWATSQDLLHWTSQGPCTGDVNAPAEDRGFRYQEAPYVFHWQSRYWLLTDPHQGLAVYSSSDATRWILRGRILQEPGSRRFDNSRARHPSVAVVGDRAFLFYHVEPGRPYPSPPPEKRTIEQKKSYLQITELLLHNDGLTADRDRTAELPADLSAQ